MLVVKSKKILLVPKGIVSYSKAFTPEKYYNHFILEFLQNEHLRMRTALVQKRVNGTPFVTKKSIKENLPISKEFLRTFTKDHPEVLEQFKERTEVSSLTNKEIDDIDIQNVIKFLIEKLNTIESGTAYASEYHNLIIGVLEIIFYPHLINPRKEVKIHGGRKRIDITFDNAASRGIFNRLSENHSIPCGYIFVECKNYSDDIENPELDQLSGRFSVNKGRVGFLICRSIKNYNLFIQRCIDTYNDGRGLIIPLVDSELIELLNNYNDWNQDYTEKFLSDKARKIMMG